jgi:hypothetical protein
MAFYPPRSDFSTYRSRDGTADMDPSWRPIGGPRAVLEHVARRITSPPGSYDDPDWGFDVTTFLNAALLTEQFNALQAAVRNEAVQVEGVDDCAVSTSLSGGGLQVALAVTLENRAGTFDLVFVLSAATIPLIFFPQTT